MAVAVLPAWCRIVREMDHEVVAEFKRRPVIAGPEDAVAYVAPRLGREEVEIFAVLLLDAQRRIMGLQEISRGLVDSTLVHPREVFRVAVAMGAHTIVLAHNHPSGVTVPSPEDRVVTKQLVAAGRVLGIAVLDHVIVSSEPGQFHSFAEMGLLEIL